MKNIKRILSKILAFILIFGTVVPNININQVKAASAILGHSFVDSLTKGITNPIPNKGNNVSPKKDEVLFNWDISKIDNQNMDGQPIELSYLLDNNKKAVLTVTKTGSEARVTFHLYDASNVIIPVNSFEIYHNNVGTAGGGFMTAAAFQPLVTPTDLYQVNSVNTPDFTLRKGGGLTFKVNGIEMSFLWDSTSSAKDTFYFQTDNLVQGHIYDANLRYYPAKVEKIQVLNSINEDKLRIIPYANDNNTVNRNLDLDMDLIPSVLNIDVLDLTLPATLMAGEDTAGLIIGFDLPTGYDPGILPDPGMGRIDAFIELKNTKASDIIVVKLEDIFRAPTATVTSGAASASIIMNGNRMRVKINGITQGKIYNTSKIKFDTSVSNRPNLVARDVNIDFPEVFSFIKYNIVSQNGQYKLQIIDPYKKYSGKYYLQIGNSIGNMTVTEIINSNGAEDKISFTISEAQLAGEKYFQILFRPDGHTPSGIHETVYSQISKFSITDQNLSIGIANNFEILDYNLIPDPADPTRKTSTLEMTARWDIAPVEIIDKILAQNNPVEIEYVLNKSLNPLVIGDDIVTPITIKFEEVGGVIKATYNGIEHKITTKFDETLGKPVYVVEADFSFDAKYIDEVGGEFKYPNIYFLNIRPTEVGGTPVYVSPSNSESITLNDLTISEVPAPQNLQITDNSFDNEDPWFNFSYDMPVKKLKEFFLNNYSNPLSTDFEVSIDIYLSQNQDELKNFSREEYADRVTNSVEVVYDETVHNDVLTFSNTGSNTPLVTTSGSVPRDELRNGKIVRVSKIKLTLQELEDILTLTPPGDLSKLFRFDGLDKNQKYYITTDLVIHDLNNASDEASNTSNIVSVLTKNDKEDIDENEKSPEAPILNKEDLQNDSVTIYWDKIKPNIDPSTTDTVEIEYEIIKLTDKQIAENIINSKIKFEKFYTTNLNNIKETEKTGLRTNNGILEIFKNGSFTPVDKNLYDFDDKTGVFKLYDKTLAPNELYFYYVRTVRIVNGERNYSVWSDISATTTPVIPPKNLVISNKKIEYIPEKEFVIEFDAPISEISKLGTEFWLEYSIKENDGEFSNPIKMDVGMLKAYHENLKEPGFLHFYYKVGRLTQGASYEIRVRIIDKKNDASIYSNIAKTRTDIDQEIQDEMTETETWIDYSEQEFQKLLNQGYWTLLDNKDYYEIAFRENMFEGNIAGIADGVYNLPMGNGQDMSYYIPASALAKLNQLNKGLRVTNGDMEVIISANAINENTNEAIKNISDLIRKNVVADYYIKLNVRFEKGPNKIESKDVIGDIAKVYFDVIGVDKKISSFDSQMYSALKNEIDYQIKDNSLKNKLKNMVISKDEKENLVKAVAKEIESTKNYLSKVSSKELKTITKRNISIAVIDAPIIIVINNQDPLTSVYGYQSINNLWQTMNVEQYNQSKAMYANNPGIYGFAGSIISILGLDQYDRQADIRVLISKYGLEDFFGKNHISINDPATKNMVQGSAARMMGAAKGQDNVAFLKTKGLQVNSRGIHNQINIQNSVHVLMSVYEFKTKTKIDTIQIKNHNTIKSIVGLDENNKKSVQVAIESGIYTNMPMQPNKNISIKELLDILLALEF